MRNELLIGDDSFIADSVHGPQFMNEESSIPWQKDFSC